MKLRANKKNIKLYAKDLLGVEYTPEKEKELINLCTKKSVYDYWDGHCHKSFGVSNYMSAIDKLIGTYGVESLYPEVDLEYCNAGDTYNITLYYFNDKLYIGDWGSIAEQYIK